MMFEKRVGNFTAMKKILTLLLVVLCGAAPLSAQPRGAMGGYGRPGSYRYGGYERPHGRYDRSFGMEDMYFGLRAGMTVASIHSQSPEMAGISSASGIFLGLSGGRAVLPFAPLYIESGLFYTEKGGRRGSEMTYDLNYLEVPVMMRYKLFLTPAVAIQPFGGVYLACGVGGQIRNYQTRTSVPSFSQTGFNRFDTGVKLGCSLNLAILHLEAAYDIGMANISRDDFVQAHNGCFYLSFGFSF